MNETTDPYLDVLYEQWDNIFMLYNEFEDKHPVMLYDIQEAMIYAYPYQEYQKEFSEKSRASLAEQYEEALQTNSIVVFIRDNENRKLMSYSFPYPEQESTMRTDPFDKNRQMTGRGRSTKKRTNKSEEKSR